VCAVVKLKIERAVIPFVREAKQDFRVEAVPTLSSRICMLREETKEVGSRVLASGPETTREGSVQELEEESELEEWEDEIGGEGGGPMMPPSRKEMEIG
jgi:hypothetical protein